MVSSCEHSAFLPTRSPGVPLSVPGVSSGGGASVFVALGSKATAGETILAEIGTPNTPLAFRVA